MRSESVAPPSVSIRSASLRAAATKVGSFNSVSAWSGVLVDFCRTEQYSRSPASRIAMVGGARVRFQ